MKKAEPVPRRIIIVGNNATGTSVASAARKQDRKAEISVIDRGTHMAYSRYELPYVLADEISARAKSLLKRSWEESSAIR